MQRTLGNIPGEKGLWAMHMQNLSEVQSHLVTKLVQSEVG